MYEIDYYKVKLLIPLQVIVRGAGHILPHDQPERALDMLNRFIGYLSHWEF